MAIQATNILLFSKSPDCTEAKTRLRNSNFSDSEINQLHSAFVNDTLLTLSELASNNIFCLWYPEIPKLAENYSNFKHFQQTGTNFSERIDNARQQAFETFKQPLVIIGSDCPLLEKDILTEALEQVNQGKLVLGPSQNGGFYLLGIPLSAKSISIGNAFQESNEILNIRSLYSDYSLHLLQHLYDIDTVDNLIDLKNYCLLLEQPNTQNCKDLYIPVHTAQALKNLASL